jgi:hypothetical protein
MPTKYGLGALNQAFNSSNQNNFNATSGGGNIFQPVRVKSIVLNESHPRFKELGEWNGLGIIEYEPVDNPQTVSNPLPTSRPLLSNNKSFPLINEIVFLFSLPNTNIGQFTTANDNYYLTTIALWNHPHHNAYPTQPNTLPPTQQKDYIQTQAGSVRRVTDQSTEIFLGETFKEKSNIHPILPFEGDIINEGRWGNSIRIGSTVQNTPNNWSSTGSNGDPILILRNGQGSQTKEGWIPTVEDINNDNSSIYLTTTQQINLTPSSQDYNSYSTQPIATNQYSNPQIILNSGRLVFNSSQDNILLTSRKSVGLNAVESVNIDTKQTIINSSQVLLGSKDANESVLKGDTTIQILSDLLTELIALTQALISVTPQGGPLVNPAATQLLPELVNIKTKLETQTKSKISKTL